MAHMLTKHGDEAACGLCGGSGKVGGAVCTCQQSQKDQTEAKASSKKMTQRGNAGSGQRGPIS